MIGFCSCPPREMKRFLLADSQKLSDDPDLRSRQSLAGRNSSLDLFCLFITEMNNADFVCMDVLV